MLRDTLDWFHEAQKVKTGKAISAIYAALRPVPFHYTIMNGKRDCSLKRYEMYNKKRDGNTFDNQTMLAVWNKGRIVNGYSPTEWRYDTCGKPIKYSDYGNTNSDHGWEIDHIFPVAKGGTDDLINLQPLQWVNNRQKSDAFPWFG